MGTMDIRVENGGSVVLLVPATDDAKDWLESNVGADNGYQPYWPTCVVEARYADDILAGMLNDGLEVV